MTSSDSSSETKTNNREITGEEEPTSPVPHVDSPEDPSSAPDPKDLEKMTAVLERVAENPELAKDPEILASVFSSISFKSERYSTGFIPPMFLEGYEKLMPGYGQRFLEDVFVETEFSRKLREREMSLQEESVRADLLHQKLGLGLGTFIALVSIGACIYMATGGYSWPAVAVVGVPVALMVGAIVRGRF